MESAENSQLTQTLTSLRRKIRRRALVEGTAFLIFCVGFLFWLSILLDRFLEPEPWVRQLALVIAFVWVSWVVWRLIIVPLRVKISNHSLSVILERKFPHLNDALLTVTEPEKIPHSNDAGEMNRVLWEKTCENLNTKLKSLDFSGLFSEQSLFLALFLALLATSSVSIFAREHPDLMRIWLNRTFSFSTEAWPRRILLDLDGFTDGKIRIARGSDFEIRILARPADSHRPFNIEKISANVHFRTSAGVRQSVSLMRENVELPSNFIYSHQFKAVLEPFSFDISIGDASIRDLHVEVVDSPTLTNIELCLNYPGYMDKKMENVHVSGLTSIPQGSAMKLRARSNKPLKSVCLSKIVGEEDPVKQVILPNPENLNTFSCDLGTMEQDQIVILDLTDCDDIQSLVPMKIPLVCVTDTLPNVKIVPDGIGSAVTPNAQIPVRGKVTDDYGLSRIWCEYRSERGTGTAEIAQFPHVITEYVCEGESRFVLQLEPLGLKPGDKLQFGICAEDKWNLTTGMERVGHSDALTLDVVPPERLRVLLEARELTLRELFEVVRKEFAESRQTLADLKYPIKSEHTEEFAAEAGILTYQIERVIQNNRKNSYEIAGVAEGIDNCCQQMVNNRIDTVEWYQRLEIGVHKPLFEIHKTSLPALETALFQWKTVIAEATPEYFDLNQKIVVKKMDEILIQMDAVLEKMAQLQDYNELVNSLRTLIREEEELQRKLQERTRAALSELEDLDE